MAVVLGIDRLLASGHLAKARVGLVANPASVDAQLSHTADRLLQAHGVVLAALFGPQHRFEASAQDNMIETSHSEDARRRVPVYSLYSETREPTGPMLANLDVLVIDLQDVGTRVYTFAYTMANCLRAAARHGVPVIVCDRPNPIGGTSVEGPVLEPGFESFVGLFPIPLRHGMTMGELARLFNDHYGIGARLEVAAMEGWTRDQFADTTGLPWVMPSPNMPTLDTAIVYPGAVLFEGTILSEGRGTTRPFELIGAPWIDPVKLVDRLNALDLSGLRWRPAAFEPTFHKFAGEACGGCQLHVVDRRAFRPVLAAVSLMRELYLQAPDRFAWRPPPYEYEHEKMPIDILAGSAALRSYIERGEDPRAIADTWAPGVNAFAPVRARYLLYD